MKALLMFILLFKSINAFSLSCIGPSDEEIQERVHQSQEIIIGTISHVNSVKQLPKIDWPYDSEQIFYVEVLVNKVIKGEARKKQIMEFSYSPTIDETYLIFDNSAFSSSCDISLSVPLRQAKSLLEILNYPLTPEVDNSRLSAQQ